MANYIRKKNEDDVIPESILSVSKDVRYIQQFQELLKQFLKVVIERKEILVPSLFSRQEHKHELQQIRKQTAWVISSVLYILISATTSRTLGMESLGLKFSPYTSTSSKAKVHGMTITRLCRPFPMHISLILAVIWSSLSDYFFCNNSIERQGFGKEGDFKFQQEHRERSRGTERLMIHERLRRQMLDRAAESDGVSSTSRIAIFNQQGRQQIELRRGDASSLERASGFSTTKLFLSLARRLTKVSPLSLDSIQKMELMTILGCNKKIQRNSVE